MPETPQLPNGWNSWGNHVLKALESNETDHKDLNIIMNKLVIDMAVLKTRMTIRAGFTGALSGVVSGIMIGIVVWLITKSNV